MSHRPMGIGRVAVFATVTLLVGCTTALVASDVEEEPSKRVAELGEVFVAASNEPPTSEELSDQLGAGAEHPVEDLNFYIAELDLSGLKEVHKATSRGQKRQTNPLAYLLLAPIAAVTWPMWIDAPMAAAYRADKSDQIEKETAKRLKGWSAVFVYDKAGNYRWQACCFGPGITDDKGPRDLPFPEPKIAVTPDDLVVHPAVYHLDYTVLICHRAKLGDEAAQFLLFNRFKRTALDFREAYYWWQTVRAADWLKGSNTPDPVEKGLSASQISAGGAYLAANPLESRDCRALATDLIAAEDEHRRSQP